MSNKPLESQIETRLKERIKHIGGLCYKFKSTVSGVPDQVVIYDGVIHLVEVKRPDETPRRNQVHVHEQIEKQGVPVHVVDTYDSIDTFITDTLGAKLPVTRKKEAIPAKIHSKDSFKIKNTK